MLTVERRNPKVGILGDAEIGTFAGLVKVKIQSQDYDRKQSLEQL